jgi:hypothetical protein
VQGATPLPRKSWRTRVTTRRRRWRNVRRTICGLTSRSEPNDGRAGGRTSPQDGGMPSAPIAGACAVREVGVFSGCDRSAWREASLTYATRETNMAARDRRRAEALSRHARRAESDRADAGAVRDRDPRGACRVSLPQLLPLSVRSLSPFPASTALRDALCGLSPIVLVNGSAASFTGSCRVESTLLQRAPTRMLEMYEPAPTLEAFIAVQMARQRPDRASHAPAW